MPRSEEEKVESGQGEEVLGTGHWATTRARPRPRAQATALKEIAKGTRDKGAGEQEGRGRIVK